MVNLIIISNNPKTENIERLLQTKIEVKIDVVADIDQALRDIFVKRPEVVCIQNRISDINADEIARHIKMLLRDGAPSFILMHEGDGKPVQGLFEHLLDLSLPETELAYALDAALKSILGIQWEHASMSSRPQKDSSLEKTDFAPKSTKESPGAEEDDAFVLVNSLDEFMTTMPEPREHMGQENSSDSAPDDTSTDIPGAESPVAAPDKKVSPPQLSEYVKPAKVMTHDPFKREDTADPFETKPPQSPSSQHPASQLRPAQAHPAAGTAQQDKSQAPKSADLPHSAAPVPGAFRINTAAAAAAGQYQSDLVPFPENFEQPGRKWKRGAGIAIAVIFCTTAWYLLRQRPLASTHVPLPPPAATSEQPKPAAPVPTEVPKPIPGMPPSDAKAAAPAPDLPAFVPADGLDSAYAARHQGWERYKGTDFECRIFREKNRIKAVQVLSGNRQGLDEKLLKKVLAELVGNDHYKIAGRERINGYLMERGSVAGKADLMFYIQNSKLHAFVVSLNQ